VRYGTHRFPETVRHLALLTAVRTERTTPRIIVGAAIIDAGRVLACARAQPPEMAGRWEFPGGKVEPGEDDAAALVRECREELAVDVTVGGQVGPAVPLGDGRAVLRVYTARLCGAARPRLIEHLELRWLAADQLSDVDWLPADAPIVEALRQYLSTAGVTGS
jgi:8-oxo-dGTP diphosphatase